MCDGLLDLLHAANMIEEGSHRPEQSLDAQESSQNVNEGLVTIPRRKRRKKRKNVSIQAQRRTKEDSSLDIGYQSSHLDSTGIDHGLFVPPPTHPRLYKIYQEYCVLVQKRYYSIPTDVESLDAELHRVCDEMRNSIHELIQ
jgi:hypothetical protein